MTALLIVFDHKNTWRGWGDRPHFIGLKKMLPVYQCVFLGVGARERGRVPRDESSLPPISGSGGLVFKGNPLFGIIIGRIGMH